jgi:hypothetical protein
MHSAASIAPASPAFITGPHPRYWRGFQFNRAPYRHRSANQLPAPLTTLLATVAKGKRTAPEGSALGRIGAMMPTHRPHRVPVSDAGDPLCVLRYRQFEAISFLGACNGRDPRPCGWRLAPSVRIPPIFDETKSRSLGDYAAAWGSSLSNIEHIAASRACGQAAAHTARNIT